MADETKAIELKISQGGSMMNGSYRIQRIIATDGSVAPTMSLTATTEQEFEIPAKVVNLSKSVLSFDVLVPAQGVAEFTKVHYLGACEIDRISLQTRGGTYLMDINHAGRVSKMLVPASTQFEDYLTGGFHDSAATVAECGMVGKKFGFSNDVGGNTALIVGGYTDKYIDAGAVLSNAETKQLMYQQVGTSATNAAIAYRVQLNLGDAFPHTICALNKDLYFGGEILRLKIHWNNSRSFLFTTDAADDTTNETALAVAHQLSNVYLHLAVENDPDIASAVVQNTLSNGVSLLMPYIHTRQQTTSASTSKSVTNKYNLGHGRRVQRIYTSGFSPNAPLFVNNNDNAADTRITSYDTSIDGVKQMDYAWNQFNNWLHTASMLKGSAVMNNELNAVNYVHIENFDSNRSTAWRKLDDEQVSRGVDLSQELLYGYDGTWTGADADEILQVAVCEKQLNISAQGIALS